jgi:hypothetical protein
MDRFHDLTEGTCSRVPSGRGGVEYVAARIPVGAPTLSLPASVGTKVERLTTPRAPTDSHGGSHVAGSWDVAPRLQNRSGGLLGDDKIHRMAVGNATRVAIELYLPRVQDLPVPVVPEQLAGAIGVLRGIHFGRRIEIGLGNKGVHRMNASPNGVGLEVSKTGRSGAPWEIVEDPGTEDHIESTTQLVGSDVADAKAHR